MDKQKTVLILGAGRGQIGLYKAAKELGIRTIAGTMLDGNPPCIPLADEVCEMNIMDPDVVEEKAAALTFDGVATCCLDKGLKALGRLCDVKQIPGYSEQTANLCNDKWQMKECFAKFGVGTAPFKKVYSIENLEEVVDELGGYPVIIKATDLAGSRGIYKATNPQEAIDGFRKAIADTSKNYLIIEKFIEGKEFGAQAFIQNGEIFFIMPHGDLLFHAATDVPVGHYVPYTLDESLMTEIKNETEKAIRALGLDNCAVNLDFIEKDGKVYVLELSGRIGANGLPEVVSGYYSIDYYKMVLLAALGLDAHSVWDKAQIGEAVMSKMLYTTDKAGILKNISLESEKGEGVSEIQLFAKPGTVVHPFANSSHCLGQVIVKATTIEECERIAKNIIANLNINVIPTNEE